jgi:hypothetical protein
MSRIRDLLYSYVFNPSTDNRLELAEEYFIQKQYAAAVSYYLKTAETTDNKNIQYYCLIQCGKCFEIPANRKHSVMTLYKHAMHILPDRPEAYYYLSKIYEAHSDWYDSYTFAHLGLQKPEVNDRFTKSLGYQGKYFLIFQKAIAAWHVGKGQEARYLLQDLINNYLDKLDEVHKQSVFRNAQQLGSGPAEISNVFYYQGSNRLRFNFNNWQKIVNSYSQVLQDIFILSMLNGKENGTYLEIGSGDPQNLNNSYLLETVFNWTGLSIDLNKSLIDKYKNLRKNPAICEDATKLDYTSLLSNISKDNTVDYLQLDCDPSNITYEILTKIPFDKYKFRVITYEHDYYLDITRSYKQKSREFLEKNGYLLVVNDVSPEGSCSFEDWWVHPDLVDKRIIDIMMDNDLSKTKDVKSYMFK